MLRRRAPRREPLSRVLIVCEGSRTEPEYLKWFKRTHHNRLIDIVVFGGEGVPKTVVGRAVELWAQASREARRMRDQNLRYDEVWCVFDVDEHPNVSDAVNQAHANRVELALSNPCFELWLNLHFAEHNKSVTRHQAQKSSRDFLPDFSKGITSKAWSILEPLYSKAVERAVTLDKWQHGRGKRGDNPWTGVHLLTERLIELGRRSYK